MSNFKVYNIYLDEAYQLASANTQNVSEYNVDESVTLNNMYYYTYQDSDNPAPTCPTGYVVGNAICLPSLLQINEKTFNSNTAILSLYFIQSFVFMFKNYSPSGATYSTEPYLPPYIPDDQDQDQEVRTTIQDYLSDAKIFGLSPSGPSCVKMLTYSSQKNKDIPPLQSYGGCILEYSLNNDLTSFIVLRGTQTETEWFEDSRVNKTGPTWLTNNISSTPKVHVGFNEVYTNEIVLDTSLRMQINDYLTEKNSQIFNLIITGHSLGSGITYLLAADLSKSSFNNIRNKTKFFPFAGPYSGNQQFVDIITNTNPKPPVDQLFAVINTADAVPTTQLPFYARIPSQLFFFTDKGPTGSPASYPHLPSTYRSNLEAAAVTFNGIGNNYSITYV